MPPGILTADAFRSGDRSARSDLRFLTVPLDGGSVDRHQNPGAASSRNLASVSPGRFVWAASRRYIYFEGRAGDTQNVWRVTVDPLTEEWMDGPERMTTGAGTRDERGPFAGRHETALHSDVQHNAVLGVSVRPIQRPHDGPAVSDHSGSTGEVDFDVRADGSKVVYRTVRAGRSELWERSIVEGQDRLLLASTGHPIRETVVVAGRRAARVLPYPPTADHMAAVGGPQFGWHR